MQILETNKLNYNACFKPYKLLKNKKKSYNVFFPARPQQQCWKRKQRRWVAPAGVRHGGEAGGLRAGAASVLVAQAAQDDGGSSRPTSANFAEGSGNGAGSAEGRGAQVRQGRAASGEVEPSGLLRRAGEVRHRRRAIAGVGRCWGRRPERRAKNRYNAVKNELKY